MPLLTSRRSGLNSALDGSSQQPVASPAPVKHSSTLSPHATTPPARPKSEYGFPTSRLSHEVRPEDVTDQRYPKPKQERFGLLRFRNVSEPQLAARASADASNNKTPPMPALPRKSHSGVPAIVKTGPQTVNGQEEKENIFENRIASLFSKPGSRRHESKRSSSRRLGAKDARAGRPKVSAIRWHRADKAENNEAASWEAAENTHDQVALASPPPYGDVLDSTATMPLAGRVSNSDRSEGSNASSDHVYGSTTTTTHTISTQTTFFRLPRRSQNRRSLFPLHHACPRRLRHHGPRV